MNSHALSLRYSGAVGESDELEQMLATSQSRTSKHWVDHRIRESRPKDGDHRQVTETKGCMAVEAKPYSRDKGRAN